MMMHFIYGPRGCCGNQGGGIREPFEFGTGVKPEAAISEVCIAHLLLDEHLLDGHARVVHRGHLPRDWAPLLVTSCQRAHTGSSIMYVVFLADSGPGPADLTFFHGQFLPALVPHKI